MLRIFGSVAYRKCYKQMSKRGYNMDLLDAAVEILHEGRTLPPKYNDHALQGKYRGHRECHIQPDWLLVYKIERDVLTLTLVKTGTHADLFG